MESIARGTRRLDCYQTRRDDREETTALFTGELTPQVGMSNCKTWYENEFQVSYETWPQTRSFSYQVLQSSFLENSGNPNLSG